MRSCSLFTIKTTCNILVTIPAFYFLSAIVYPWLDFGLLPQRPQFMWCHWGEIEPYFPATLVQVELAKCDQPEKNPLEYSAVVGNWTRATGRTDSELYHWAIMTALFNSIRAAIIKVTVYPHIHINAWKWNLSLHFEYLNTTLHSASVWQASYLCGLVVHGRTSPNNVTWVPLR